ncbi:hypothetical protein [Photobacterium kishitanii]|uniref:hypothetical protein n=1 Tax=Photobacterium kishitanii TaxID=318456 RepID=UPI0011B1D8BD|nr:hypothetical protein [Photobacterium kishitanii]
MKAIKAASISLLFCVVIGSIVFGSIIFVTNHYGLVKNQNNHLSHHLSLDENDKPIECDLYISSINSSHEMTSRLALGNTNYCREIKTR